MANPSMVKEEGQTRRPTFRRWLGRFLLLASGICLGAAGTVSSGGQPAAEAELVTGIGGVFFKAEDPEALRTWYRDHLGIVAGAQGADFSWREIEDPERTGRTVWSVFPEESEYFGPGDQEWMVNYRVRDLDAVLAHLRASGVEPVAEVEEYPYGRFTWIVDGEGNRVELWEPPSTPARRSRFRE